MRLICPNCDAEYQVDDAAIPEAGRDVQCSNCGHAWFQLPADAVSAQEAEEELFGVTPLGGEPSSVPEPAQVPPSDRVPVIEPERIAKPVADLPVEDGLPGGSNDPDTEFYDDSDLPRPVAPRQTLAESVLSVLREEAERETAVRREEDPAPRVVNIPRVETQTEFGLETSAPVSGASAAARHIARLKGADEEVLPETRQKAAARRDLLPDIEEINSTLRTDTDRAQGELDDIDALPAIKPRRRGFRSGFVLMMMLAVILALAYVMAPRIMAQMPGSAPTMRAYVAAIDETRLWLDSLMKSASGSLRSVSGDTN